MEGFQLGFRQNRIPTCLLGMPGIFHPTASHCCLACPLSVLGRTELVCAVISKGLSVEDLSQLEDPVATGLSPQDCRVLNAVARNILDASKNDNLPIFHPNFFRPTQFVLTSPHPSFIIPNGQLELGNVLEVFMDSAPTPFIMDLLNGLSRSVLGLQRPFDNYTSIKDQLPLPSTLAIHVGEEKMVHHCWSSPGMLQVNHIEFQTDKDESFEDQIWTLESKLIPLKGVSLIIVDSVTTGFGFPRDADKLPTVKMWLDFIYGMLGGLDDVLVVFLVDCLRFIADGIEDKAVIRNFINGRLSGEQSSRIHCIDILEMRPDQIEAQSLPLFQLND